MLATSTNYIEQRAIEKFLTDTFLHTDNTKMFDTKSMFDTKKILHYIFPFHCISYSEHNRGKDQAENICRQKLLFPDTHTSLLFCVRAIPCGLSNFPTSRPFSPIVCSRIPSELNTLIE